MRKLSILSHLSTLATKLTDEVQNATDEEEDEDEDEAIMHAAGAHPAHSRDATARRQRSDSVERVAAPEGSLAVDDNGVRDGDGDGTSGEHGGAAAHKRGDGGGSASASPSTTAPRSPPPQPPPPLGVRSDYEWTTRAARGDNNPFILNPYHLSRDASASRPAPDGANNHASDYSPSGSRELAAAAAAAAAAETETEMETADCCSICLGPKKNPVVLPACAHSFCRLCLAEVREKCMPGAADACPLCRTPLPEGPNRAYDEAILCWIKIDHATNRGEVDWGALPMELQREWSQHLLNLQDAADTACHSLSCHWLGYCYHKVGRTQGGSESERRPTGRPPHPQSRAASLNFT